MARYFPASSPVHTLNRTPTGGCGHARCCQPHYEQLRPQCLAQGHSNLRSLIHSQLSRPHIQKSCDSNVTVAAKTTGVCKLNWCLCIVHIVSLATLSALPKSYWNILEKQERSSYVIRLAISFIFVIFAFTLLCCFPSLCYCKQPYIYLDGLVKKQKRLGVNSGGKKTVNLYFNRSSFCHCHQQEMTITAATENSTSYRLVLPPSGRKERLSPPLIKTARWRMAAKRLTSRLCCHNAGLEPDRQARRAGFPLWPGRPKL